MVPASTRGPEPADAPQGRPSLAAADPSGDPQGAADLAAALLRQRGAEASHHAMRCAEICLIRGQSAGYAAWRLVLRAIERLEGAETAGDPATDAAFAAGPLDPLLRARDAVP